MKQTYIETMLKAVNIDVPKEDLPWIQYMVNTVEPIMSQITPSYYKGSKVDKPWVFELVTFNWR